MRRSILFTLLCPLSVSPLASTAGPGTSPCTLVTAKDAKKALGAPVGPKKEQLFGLYESCTQATKSSRTPTVQTRPVSHPDFVASARANPGPVRQVAGIGSDAYSVAGGSSLLVWRNGTEITFLVIGVANPLAAEKQLAKKAVSRL